MTSLTEFLLARIAEDEAVAEHEDGGLMTEAHFSKIRVLAECEAKRRIAEEHEQAAETAHGKTLGSGCLTCDYDHEYGFQGDGPCATLRFLAQPYADHADFDEAWRT